MILTTTQGAFMTWAGGFDVKLFGLITLPRIIGKNLDMYPIFKNLHYTLWMMLLATFFLHLIGGLYHYFNQDKYSV